MYHFLVLLTAAVFSTSVAAAPKQVGFTALKTEALAAEKILNETGDDCNFSVSPTSTGVKFFIGSTDGNVFVHVSKTDKVSLTTKEEFDGSFKRTYMVKGVGTFTFTHADDAYDLVELYSDLAHRSGACSVNY